VARAHRAGCRFRPDRPPGRGSAPAVGSQPGLSEAAGLPACAGRSRPA
jgi:hypothetical protein